MTLGGDGFQLRRWVRPVQGNTSFVGWLPKAARQRLNCRSAGNVEPWDSFGELAVGLGPRSRFGIWAYRRWWHLPLVFGLCYGLLMFGISYFGVVNSRNEHHFVASLVEAAILGAIFGLLMLGRPWWLQPKADQEGD